MPYNATVVRVMENGGGGTVPFVGVTVRDVPFEPGTALLIVAGGL